MKPTFPVTTHIDIDPSDDLILLAGRKVDCPKICALVISSHKLWLTMIALLLIRAAQASSAAIVLTDKMIVIAADGIGTRTGTGVRTFEAVCKIRREARVFYVATGLYEFPGPTFDAWALAKEAIRKSKTIIGIYGLIETTVLDSLPDVVERSKTIDPKNYARWLTGIPVLTISFASFENAVPIVITINFKIDTDGKVVKPARTTQHGMAGMLQNALLGYNAEMKAATVAPTWGVSFTRNPTGFVQGLIQREIDTSKTENRNDVGPPISILRITATGGNFEAGYKGACP